MIENNTPYKAERTWVRDKNGVHHWIVVVKATYDIAEDGYLTLAKDPLDPLYAPEYFGEDGLSSIRYEADLVAMKPGTDVLVNGTAYAQNGEPALMVPVTLEIQNIRKELHVYGDRVWQRSGIGLETSPPSHFETMPIVYERAFGGYDQTDPDPAKHRMDFRNPIGKGFAVKNSSLHGTPVPNIEYPKGALAKAGPAGFGALASYWSPRKEYAGTYDENWQNTKMPLLPDDYDERWLLSSPVDQRTSEYLQGGETIQLTNLTPEGHLEFVLPEVSFSFTTHLMGDKLKHESQLVTVLIEPDDSRLILTWQTSLKVKRNPDYLDLTVIDETKGEAES